MLTIKIARRAIRPGANARIFSPDGLLLWTLFDLHPNYWYFHAKNRVMMVYTMANVIFWSHNTGLNFRSHHQVWDDQFHFFRSRQNPRSSWDLLDTTNSRDRAIELQWYYSSWWSRDTTELPPHHMHTHGAADREITDRYSKYCSKDEPENSVKAAAIAANYPQRSIRYGVMVGEYFTGLKQNSTLQ